MKYNKINICLFMLVFLISFATDLRGQNGGTTTAQFLKLAPNARAAGMANAFTGLADDINTMYWNPGGLGFLNSFELGLSGQNLFGEMTHFAGFSSFSRPMLGSARTAFGLGLIYLGQSEDIQSTENGREPAVSSGNVSNYAFMLPFGYRLDPISKNISIGLNYKYVHSKLAEYSATGHAVDFGILAKLPTDYAEFSFGAAVQNYTLLPMKFVSVKEDLPLTFRAGAAVTWPFAEHHTITTAFDLAKPNDDKNKYYFGAEYWWQFSSANRLGVRSGYRLDGDDLGDFTFSLGFGMNLNQIDYAFNNYSQDHLGAANIASLTFRSSTLDPFKRLFPESNAALKGEDIITLSWEKSYDPTSPAIRYLVVLDRDAQKVKRALSSGKVRHILTQAETKASYRDPVQLANKLGVAFAAVSKNATSTIFRDSRTLTTKYYWGVAAANENYLVRRAGPHNVGSFTNRRYPDYYPVTLEFTPDTHLDASTLQGSLTGIVNSSGYNAAPYSVVIFDENDNAEVARVNIDPDNAVKAQSDTFTVDWHANSSGIHTLKMTVDPAGENEEIDTGNNAMTAEFATIPKGRIFVPDTVFTELRRYRSVELPTLNYVFFEPNSAEFSKLSQSIADPLAPDSLLKLLGMRLHTIFPRLDITVQGYYHPYSENEFVDGKNLAQMREDFVIDKLLEYGASKDQIKRVKAYDRSARFAGKRTEGVDSLELALISEENRRVAIRVAPHYNYETRLINEKKLFKPREFTLEASEQISHHVPFVSQIRSGRMLQNFKLEIRDNPKDRYPLASVSSIDDLAANKTIFVWNCQRISDGSNSLVAFNRDYFYNFIFTDTSGVEYKSDFSKFNLAKKTDIIQKRIFALAEFGEARPLHKFYLKYLDEIEEAMKTNPDFSVRMIGHTDKIGQEKFNSWLSARRAAALANSLDSLILNDIEIHEEQLESIRSHIETPLEFAREDSSIWQKYGAGENVPLQFSGYTFGDNSRPQGRLLNRRVEIELKSLKKHPGFKALQISEQLFFPTDSLNRGYSNSFTSIADQDSIIWIGTTSGLICWEPDPARFTRLMPFENQPVHITSLQKDDQREILWVGTQTGLFTYSLRDSLWQLYEAGRNGLTGSRINDLQLDINNHLLIASNEGVLRFNGEKFQQLASIYNGLASNFVHRIYLAPSGVPWACTRAGAYAVTGDTLRAFSPEIDGVNGLAHDDIRGMLIDAKGDYWFATAVGVRHFSGDKWEQYTAIDGLPHHEINAILQDVNGNIWCGTQGGLACYTDGQWLAYTNEEGLPENNVNNLAPWIDDAVSVMTTGGMLFIQPFEKTVELLPELPTEKR